jgi:multiple antibiotic resistance protein
MCCSSPIADVDPDPTMDLLKSFISLLALINPLGAIPIFLSLTSSQTPAQTHRTVRIASIAVVFVIGFAATFGERAIAFFGISIGSLEVGGGIIMLMMAMNMLSARTPPQQATQQEQTDAELKDNIAVVPLAIPLLTGPGTISTVIVYAGQAAHWYDRIPLIGIGAALGAICYVALRAAGPIANVVGQTGINIATRIMGLILAALAVEFMVNGLKSLFPVLR